MYTLQSPLKLGFLPFLLSPYSLSPSNTLTAAHIPQSIFPLVKNLISDSLLSVCCLQQNDISPKEIGK